jgi:hypothetical protein
VVGALVWPASLDASASRTCDMESGQPMRLSEKEDNTVSYTYSVIWTVSSLSFWRCLCFPDWLRSSPQE